MKGSNLNLRLSLHREGQFCYHLACILPFGSFKDTLNFFIYILPINTFGNKFRLLLLRFRGSHWRCSVRKGVLRNFSKFAGKHLCQGLFFSKVAGLMPSDDCFATFLISLFMIILSFCFLRALS